MMTAAQRWDRQERQRLAAAVGEDLAAEWAHVIAETRIPHAMEWEVLHLMLDAWNQGRHSVRVEEEGWMPAHLAGCGTGQGPYGHDACVTECPRREYLACKERIRKLARRP